MLGKCPFSWLLPWVAGEEIVPGSDVQDSRDPKSRGMVVWVADDPETEETWAGVLWNVAPVHEFHFPNIKKLAQQPLFIKDIVSVQPMSMPQGLLFYLDYKYGKKPDDPEKK